MTESRQHRFVWSTQRNGAVLIVAALSGGRGTLPTSDRVPQQFLHDHPGYVIESWSYSINGSQTMPVPGQDAIRGENATFQIVFRRPEEATTHIYVRKFGTVAEG
jgi:hypothetical protein